MPLLMPITHGPTTSYWSFSSDTITDNAHHQGSGTFALGSLLVQKMLLAKTVLAQTIVAVLDRVDTDNTNGMSAPNISIRH